MFVILAIANLFLVVEIADLRVPYPIILHDVVQRSALIWIDFEHHCDDITGFPR